MRKILIPLAATALVLASFPLKMKKAEDRIVVPAPSIALREIDGFRSEDVDSEKTRQTLNAKTLLTRLYTNPSGQSFYASAVISGDSRMSIHRPELCLAWQNFLIRNSWTDTIGTTAWRRLVIEHKGEPSAQFAYRFFNQEGFRTASQTIRLLVDMWDRCIHDRQDRWILVTVKSLSDDEAAMTEFLSKLDRTLP